MPYFARSFVLRRGVLDELVRPAEETLQAEELVEQERADEAERQAESDATIHTADPERAFGSVPIVTEDNAAPDESHGESAQGRRIFSTHRRGGAGWMIASLVLAVALIISLFGQFSGKSSDTVATVNGEKITKDELYAQMVPSAGKSVLDNLITMKLVDQDASNKKVTVTQEDEDKELADVKKSFGSDEQFNQALSQSGMSLTDLKTQLKMQAQLRKLLADKIKITDADIQAYYDKNKSSYATEEEVQASHILVKTKEEADAIEKELKNGGDFAKIAKEKSTDTGSAAKGGDLGYFGKGQMVPEFEKAAFDLKVGETSEPIKSDYGYHIIKVVDHKQATTATLDEKKAEIKEQLENQQLGTLSQTLLSDLHSKASINNTLDPASGTTGKADNNGAANNS